MGRYSTRELRQLFGLSLKQLDVPLDGSYGTQMIHATSRSIYPRGVDAARIAPIFREAWSSPSTIVCHVASSEVKAP